ncbi:MAG: hypothetical protein ACLQMF_01010 [Rectinemataceae bacterium]
MTFNIAVEDDLGESVARKILDSEGCFVARRFPDRERLRASPGKEHLVKKIAAYNASSAIVPYLDDNRPGYIDLRVPRTWPIPKPR